MTNAEAIAEAQDLLRDEANELALLQHNPEYEKLIPHRAKVAISREIRRFREIADGLQPRQQDTKAAGSEGTVLTAKKL